MQVIDTLRSRGAVSRADIARQTGLSPLDRVEPRGRPPDGGPRGRARDEAIRRGRQGGRPPVMVALDRSAGTVVGIDFAHDHLRVAVADLSYSVLAETYLEFEVDTAAEDALDTAAALVAELVEEAGVERERVLGVGMGLPGPIDRESGMVHSSRSCRAGWGSTRRPSWRSA